MSKWFIVQTNPQCEAKAVAEIRRAGFRAYLPKFAKVRRHHRTKQPIVSRRPLMTGYVFMRFPGPVNWYALRQCQGVKGVLYLDNRPYAVDSADIASIMRAQRGMSNDTQDARAVRRARMKGEKNAQRALTKDRFFAGMKVREPSGPYEAFVARILSVTNRGTIRAVVDIFGRDTPVEFTDIDNLEIVDSAA